MRKGERREINIHKNIKTGQPREKNIDTNDDKKKKKKKNDGKKKR